MNKILKSLLNRSVRANVIQTWPNWFDLYALCFCKRQSGRVWCLIKHSVQDYVCIREDWLNCSWQTSGGRKCVLADSDKQASHMGVIKNKKSTASKMTAELNTVLKNSIIAKTLYEGHSPWKVVLVKLGLLKVKGFLDDICILLFTPVADFLRLNNEILALNWLTCDNSLDKRIKITQGDCNSICNECLYLYKYYKTMGSRFRSLWV